ncbi:hypothetical protein [Neoaquamicrobium sediminum]|uniref:hypothetical protein n=1 Tax=Neoaquamicrobium sediminum TaxID=1849104 RepID=UPI003BA8494C
MLVNIDGQQFEAEDAIEGILINPVLPDGFHSTRNEARPQSHARFWNRPYIEVREHADGRDVTVRCLDGGAWDRPTLFARFASIQEALDYLGATGRTHHDTISVGRTSPWGAFAQGAALYLGSRGNLSLVLSAHQPSKREVRAARNGRIDTAMLLNGMTAILLVRFNDGKGRKVLSYDCSLHIGLERLDVRQAWLQRAGASHPLSIVLQDGLGVIRALRVVELDREFSTALDAVIAAQAEEPSRPDWSPAVHHAELERYFSDFPSPADAFALTDAAARRS